MASTDDQATFENSFAALVSYLQAVIVKDTIEIPDNIIQPFKLASQPINPSVLRPLLKLFDGVRQQHNVQKLDTSSLAGVVSIVFHLPHSIAQEKLLHIILNAIQDDKIRLESLSKRLIHGLLRRLVSDGLDSRLRWISAQFISVLVTQEASRDRLRRYKEESRHLQALLVSNDDYVTRFLVADLVRELCAHGAAIEDFFAPGTATQTILGFPHSTKCDVTWLRRLQGFFSDVDKTTAFTGKTASIASIVDVKFDDGDLQWDGGGIVVIAERLVVLSIGNGIQIASMPVLPAPQMTANVTGDDTNRLRINYVGDSGYRVQDGTKRAVNMVSLHIALDEERATALDNVLYAQKLALDTKPGTPVQHRSLALLDLWTGELGGATAKVPQKEHLKDTLDSPLEHLSQRRAESVARPEEDTASESSFLGSRADKSRFTDKLFAAQDTPMHAQKAISFTQAADKAVERSRSRSSARVPPGMAVAEGATNTGPPLPPKQVHKSRPLVPTFQSSAPTTGKKSGVVRTDSAFDPKPLPPPRVPTKPQTASKRAPLATKSTNLPNTSFELPMAKLAAKQPQPAAQEPQASTRLKRKSRNQGQDVQDETFNEDMSFDIPEDTSQDERPSKKIKTQAGKTKKAPAKTQATQSAKQTKPVKATTKKPLSKPAARLQADAEPTIAATRQRRAVNKISTYEEVLPLSMQEISDDEGMEVDVVPTEVTEDRHIEAMDKTKSEAGGASNEEDLAEASPVREISARNPPPYHHASPDLEDEEPVKPAPISQPQMSKNASRSSIGLGGMLENRYPEAAAGILGGRKEASAHDLSAFQTLMPPPDKAPGTKPMSKAQSLSMLSAENGNSEVGQAATSKDRQPPRTGSPGKRITSSSPLCAGNAPAKPDKPKVAPIRVKPTELSPSLAVADDKQPSSTPVPFHLRLARDLNKMIVSTEAPEEPQRRSCVTEDGADPTLVEHFRRRRSVSDSSNDSLQSEYGGRFAQGRSGLPEAPEDQHFKGLKDGLRTAFWQMAENSLCMLYNEQISIEKQVDQFKTAGTSAYDEMEALWRNKVSHASLKIADQLEDDKVQFQQAAVRLGGDKDWRTTLNVDKVAEGVEARSSDMTQTLEEFRKKMNF